jgi:hypothetical protein
MISAAIPGTSVEAIEYPALLTPYNSSSFNGTQTTTKQLKKYVNKCEKARIVLLGYSQGAHVVGDVMCGGGESPSLGPNTPPISKRYQNKVVAMIQMGDPRHLPLMTFDIGSSVKQGVSLLPPSFVISWLTDSYRYSPDQPIFLALQLHRKLDPIATKEIHFVMLVLISQYI